MREIVLDTETTGLDPASGHRLVEIGCVEIFNRIPTGQTFHSYFNPEREVPEEAFRVHGLSTAFLSAHPVFKQAADRFLEFIAESPLVIHNAEFDLKFLNAELSLIGKAPIPRDRTVDTLALSRSKFPGGSNSLDALCQRFKVDASRRTKHGALVDAQILAEVYVELTGGRQVALALTDGSAHIATVIASRPETLAIREFVSLLDEGDREAHVALVNQLGSSALWLAFMKDRTPVAQAGMPFD